MFLSSVFAVEDPLADGEDCVRDENQHAKDKGEDGAEVHGFEGGELLVVNLCITVETRGELIPLVIAVVLG